MVLEPHTQDLFSSDKCIQKCITGSVSFVNLFSPERNPPVSKSERDLVTLVAEMLHSYQCIYSIFCMMIFFKCYQLSTTDEKP